jgi:hypothetical protein
MRPAARDWLDRLRRFSTEHRLSRPQRPEPVPAETGTGHRSGITRSAAALAAQAALLAAHAAAVQPLRAGVHDHRQPRAPH